MMAEAGPMGDTGGLVLVTTPTGSGVAGSRQGLSRWTAVQDCP